MKNGLLLLNPSFASCMMWASYFISQSLSFPIHKMKGKNGTSLEHTQSKFGYVFKG